MNSRTTALLILSGAFFAASSLVCAQSESGGTALLPSTGGQPTTQNYSIPERVSPAMDNVASAPTKTGSENAVSKESPPAKSASKETGSKGKTATKNKKRASKETSNADGEFTPPGLIAFKGGSTQIGVDTKDVQALIEEDPRLLNRVSSVDTETPQHRVKVDPFGLMVTEVTNEQYREFVRATGHRVPQEWGAKAINEARLTFLKENPGKKFSSKDYWKKNWQDCEWDVPAEDLLNPVVYIDYADAQAYCQWAGLRLPTEFELQHAARGKSTNPYPWGEDLEPGKYAVTMEFRGIQKSLPVGWTPAGRTAEGIYDIIGNVWEWTTSPYSPYPGWKSKKYKVKAGGIKKEKMSEPNWNGDNRVSAGGSFELPLSSARATIRRGTARDQQTLGVGFRAAASTAATTDQAETLYNEMIRLSSARADGATFDRSQALGWVRWEARDSEFGEEQAKAVLKRYKGLKPKTAAYEVPQGYRVITRFDYVLFAPNEKIETASDKELQRMSLETPIQLGYISFRDDMLSPALPAGTYIAAYRHEGDIPEPKGDGDDKKKKKKDDEEDVLPPPVWFGKIDIKKTNLIFLDVATGEYVAHIEDQKQPKIETVKKEADFAELHRLEAFTKKERSKDAEGKPIFIEVPWLRFNGLSPSKVARRFWSYSFEIQPAEGFVDRDWQR